MPLKLGDRNETVRRWRIVMAARFAGYARIHGPLPGDTDEFGPRAVSWQKEYERRTHQRDDGIVSDDDLRALGIEMPPKRWLFTVQGTAQPDPMGPGLPADTARDVLDLYSWQPIGNYSARAFPMWPSVLEGDKELGLQIVDKVGPRDEINLAGYSQGAIVVGQVLKHRLMNPRGDLHRYHDKIRKVVLWGNPMREQGIAHFDEWIHPVASPDTMGILDDRLEGLAHAPFEVRDYAHEHDMYASIKADDMHEYEVAIAKIIMRATDFWSGPNSVVSQLIELGMRPLQEMIAMAGAIIDAMRFFADSTRGHDWPHLYNRFPAVEFLRNV